MTDLDLTRWCQQNAAKYREYEHINMAAPPTPEDRDTAIVEWVVRVLGNPELPESREVLRLLDERHPGDVLTEEPGPDVTAVVDRDGDRWERTPSGAWQYTGDGPAYGFHTWHALALHHGPIRRAS